MFENEVYVYLLHFHDLHIQPNVSKISAFDRTENIKGTQYEYSQNSIEMLKFLSFTVYFLHFDDFFNQMIGVLQLHFQEF